jgi:protein TonB
VTVEVAPVSLPATARPEPEPEPAPRLEPETVLAAPVDRPAPTPRRVAAPAPTPTAAPDQPVRRVYGVRKVYARGLGAGSAGGAGLVVKKGNTVDGRADTLTATEADLQGELAALSTVDRAPGPLHRVKPRYSEALVAARASGTVTAYLLVDVDGSVVDVNVTEDIGYDSREVAEAAFRQFRFSPALKGGEPVAVWILHRIRFEFQE